MKTAIFVDVQNIYYTTRDTFNRSFNYRRFWNQIESEDKIIKANAYAIDRGDERQQKFQYALQSIGFNVKLKPYISRADGSAKGDWDVGITLDMIELASEVDVVVLASGDGDFDLVVEKLRQAHSVDVEVYAPRKLAAASLIRAATRFVPIESPLLLSR